MPALSGGRWATLSLLLSLVVTGLASAYWSRVDVTAVANGAVVVQGGPRPVIARVAGTVATLTVRAGQAVVAGEEVLKLDATELEARAQNAIEQWRAVQDETQALDAKSADLHDQTVRALRVKRQLLAARARLKLWRSYLEGQPQPNAAPLQVEDVRRLDDHLAFHQLGLRAACRKFLLASAVQRESTAMPWAIESEPAEQLRGLVQKLTTFNFDLHVVNCTPAWLREELSIVKAIVPGLIPLYASVRERPLALRRLGATMPLNPAPHPFC